MIELCEVLDISEVGVAIQSSSPMEVNRQVELCLDLAEAAGQISTSARVVWSDATGRVGLGLPPLPNPALHRLREWLFLNAMAGAANAAASAESEPAPEQTRSHSEVRPTYTDTLTAASAVQREAEALGADLEAVLSLIAVRSQSLLRASGAAIALAETHSGASNKTMQCRASAGQIAPPVGSALQVGSGFSGECVRTGKILRCDDSETDPLVDLQSCRALGIRSMLAAPVRRGERVVGLLEVFSVQPIAFSEKDSAVLQRFTESIVFALDRAEPHNDNSPSPPSIPFTARPGSVLFASAPAPAEEKNLSSIADQDEDKFGGIRLPRAHLYLLIGTAATIFLALGFISAPSIQPWVHKEIEQRLQAHDRGPEHTVLASSQPPADPAASAPAPVLDSLTLNQLRDLADRGNPSAEDKMGRLYAEGDDKQGIAPDDKQAAHWFTSAAEHGSVTAQYKLGLLYWGGHHGLPKDPNQAYFWTVLARAGGQEGSKDLANLLSGSMSRAQAAAIEQQAEIWYQQHETKSKPSPAR